MKPDESRTVLEGGTGHRYCAHCGVFAVPGTCCTASERSEPTGQPEHGGRPMTLRECMEAEEPSPAATNLDALVAELEESFPNAHPGQFRRILARHLSGGVPIAASCPSCGHNVRAHHESGCVEGCSCPYLRWSERGVFEGAPIGEPEEAPEALYMCNRWGEVMAWVNEAEGLWCYDPDDVPESLLEDAPKGWSVFRGTLAPLTAEDFADEDHPVHSCGVPCEVGDEFWHGALKPATAAEVLAFFGLYRIPQSAQPEKEPWRSVREGRIPPGWPTDHVAQPEEEK